MNEFKYQLTQFIFLVLLGIGAYWALTNLDNGISYTRENIVDDAEIVPSETPIVDEVPADTDPVVDTQEPPVVETPTTSTNANESLIADLEKLISDNVTLNSGSSGTRVATVQKFLDVYFEDKTVSIDSDFGPTTKGLVRDFQQAELNGGDGRIGPNTLKAMVKYLEN